MGSEDRQCLDREEGPDKGGPYGLPSREWVSQLKVGGDLYPRLHCAALSAGHR